MDHSFGNDFSFLDIYHWRSLLVKTAYSSQKNKKIFFIGVAEAVQGLCHCRALIKNTGNKWQKQERRHEMDAQDPSKFGRWFFLAGLISIFLGFGLFLHACDNMKATKEREIMAMTKTNSIPSIGIPPIDASAPLKTETATFALG